MKKYTVDKKTIKQLTERLQIFSMFHSVVTSAFIYNRDYQTLCSSSAIVSAIFPFLSFVEFIRTNDVKCTLLHNFFFFFCFVFLFFCARQKLLCKLVSFFRFHSFFNSFFHSMQKAADRQQEEEVWKTVSHRFLESSTIHYWKNLAVKLHSLLNFSICSCNLSN